MIKSQSAAHLQNTSDISLSFAEADITQETLPIKMKYLLCMNV